MYTRQEASLLRKKFWTSFGQYMRPIPGADGEPINWLNYKTGRKHIFFRMDADATKAGIAIEFRHPDPAERDRNFQLFGQFREMLHISTKDTWVWKEKMLDEAGQPIARIEVSIGNVNIFNPSDWPSIISFFKPRIIGLDEFWSMVRDRF